MENRTYEGRYIKALKYMNKGQYAPAAFILENLYKEDPDYLNIRFEYGRALLISKIDASLGLQLVYDFYNNTGDLYALQVIARYEYGIGNVNEARAIYKRIIKLEGNDPKEHVYFELGLLEYRCCNAKDAKRYFKKTIYSQTFKSISKLILSHFALLDGDSELAIAYCEDVLADKQEYDHNGAYRMLATIYYRLGDYDKALYYAKQMNEKMYYRKEILLALIAKATNVMCDCAVHNYYVDNALNYNKEDVLDHISKHLDEIDTTECYYPFNSNVDIGTLYDECSERIKDLKPSILDYADNYCVDLGRVVGKIGVNDTTKVKIVTYINTKDILTIYTIPNCSVVSKSNKEEYEELEGKNISQIDRFNMRYKKRA